METSTYSTDEDEVQFSDFFLPLMKDTPVQDDEDDVPNRTFFLADVDAIVGPCCVVPNIGGPMNSYFQVKN